MRAAGIRELNGRVEMLDLPDPRELALDEVLIDVVAAGVGNWDEIIRTGGWYVGRGVPLALGVEAAGTVIAVGSGVSTLKPGDEVLSHPLELREQGCWAENLIAAAGVVARKPPGVPWEVAAAFPVPALTAEQVLSEVLPTVDGEWLLVHGAGGTTGGLLVQLAAVRGARVIATAGPASANRVLSLGASEVLDYNDSDWPERVRELTGSNGVEAAANAARGGAPAALRAVADGGRLATITSDAPEGERGIAVSEVYVQPDAVQLAALCELLAEGRLSLVVGAAVPLAEAATALKRVVDASSRGSMVLTMAQSDRLTRSGDRS